MSPSHHPSDEMLMEYAAGSVVEAVGVILATHLALCPRCRHRVAEYEAVGGALLDTLPPAPVAPDALSALLARLDEPEPPLPRPAAAAPPHPLSRPEALLPEPLRSYLSAAPGALSAAPGALRWRTLMPGIEMIAIPFASGNPTTRLMRIQGGIAVPRHTHEGQELTLVLAGGYRDETGRYARGDFAAGDRTVDHRQIADAGAPCLCLAVTEGPLRLTGAVGRWLNPFVRF